LVFEAIILVSLVLSAAPVLPTQVEEISLDYLTTQTGKSIVRDIAVTSHTFQSIVNISFPSAVGSMSLALMRRLLLASSWEDVQSLQRIIGIHASSYPDKEALPDLQFFSSILHTRWRDLYCMKFFPALIYYAHPQVTRVYASSLFVCIFCGESFSPVSGSCYRTWTEFFSSSALPFPLMQFSHDHQLYFSVWILRVFRNQKRTASGSVPFAYMTDVGSTRLGPGVVRKISAHKNDNY
jgi:hypothetical protein